MQFLGGTTATNEALLLASTELDRQRTTRANAEPIVVVFTDGFSQETPLPGEKFAYYSGSPSKKHPHKST